MKRKIFNKSDKSRIRYDLEFTNSNWWLRSAYSDNSVVVGFVIDFGHIYNNFTDFTYGVLLACII